MHKEVVSQVPQTLIIMKNKSKERKTQTKKQNQRIKERQMQKRLTMVK
jgi:uncharacterized membrane protein